MANTAYTNAREIIAKLYSAGYEAYFVGGFVRNQLMGIEGTDDYDICTSATPDEVKQVFAKTFDTGLAHGTVTVLLNGNDFEVTTYRIDGEYTDNRRPSSVKFTRELHEDLRRRDFTFNAMAMDLDGNVIDLFGGCADLQAKVIRAVGNPDARFKEDPLRILRGIRFLAQLGADFTIEPNTLAAMSQQAHLLANISAERIQIELVKAVTGPNVDALRVAYEAGITAHFMPEFDVMMTCAQENPHHAYHVGEHTLRTMKNIEPDKVLRLTMLWHDVAKPAMKTVDKKGIAHFKGHQEAGWEQSRHIMNRLKFDNETKDAVSHLIRWHDYDLPITPKAARKAINKIGAYHFPNYLKVRTADISGQSDYRKSEKLSALETATKLYHEMMAAGVATSLKDLAVDGHDLIDIGFMPDAQLGTILNELLTAVIDKPELNNREKLLDLAKHKRS